MNSSSHLEIKDHSNTLDPVQPTIDRMKVRGEALMAHVKDLLHEGNVRRIAVKNSDGQTVIEIPVTAGVVAAIVAPALVAVAALGAAASDWQIEVHRENDQAG